MDLSGHVIQHLDLSRVPPVDTNGLPSKQIQTFELLCSSEKVVDSSEERVWIDAHWWEKAMVQELEGTDETSAPACKASEYYVNERNLSDFLEMFYG